MQYAPFPTPSMPLPEASPRLPAPRYHHPSKPRHVLLENIEKLFGMFAVLGALEASAFSYGVLYLVREAVGMYFQRRQLDAESSGGMLAGAARGHPGPPPKAPYWGDAGCVKRTRFTVLQIHLLLLGLGMMRPDGTSKRYRVYQSNKLYRKRQRNGQLSNGTAKYFYVTAETALLVLLINLARPIAFCDMQASLNGIPSPEISLIVNFMLE